VGGKIALKPMLYLGFLKKVFERGALDFILEL
jgi:hypothetical protein